MYLLIDTLLHSSPPPSPPYIHIYLTSLLTSLYFTSLHLPYFGATELCYKNNNLNNNSKPARKLPILQYHVFQHCCQSLIVSIAFPHSIPRHIGLSIYPLPLPLRIPITKSKTLPESNFNSVPFQPSSSPYLPPTRPSKPPILRC